MTVQVAVAGASGRMGRMIIDALLADKACVLAAALEHAQSPFIGRDAGDFAGQVTGVTIGTSVEDAFAASDCLIDFTRPDASLRHLDAAVATGKSMVIGTTGFDASGKARIAEAAKRIPLVFAPNMAVGVNAVFKLLDVAARILADGYDVEVIEAHHRYKVDAPSGTALKMGEVVAQALGRDLADAAVYGREGYTGERPNEQIGFSTIRGGDIVGDHTVLFAGLGERIEITHKSSSRMPYALGALRAACFLKRAEPGLYDMQQVLGLR